MLTEFGKFCRRMRIEHGDGTKIETLRNMAKKLEVSETYVSGVERGTKNVPKEWLPKLKEIYNLSPTEEAEMYKAYEQSVAFVKIYLPGADPVCREAIMMLAKKVKNLDKSFFQQLLDKLSKHK